MPPRARRGRILAVAIDQKSGQPLYRQIYSHVRQCILDGRLAPGSRLPSTRQLAADLRVSRSTAVQAYEQLYYWAAQGLAQYGYEVLTYDVQGQGDSDLLPAGCTPSSCPGVPCSSASTESSRRLRTQPATPSARACCTQACR